MESMMDNQKEHITKLNAEIEKWKNDYDRNELAYDETASRLKATEKILHSRDRQIEDFQKTIAEQKETIINLNKSIEEAKVQLTAAGEKDQQIASLIDSIRKRDEELKINREKIEQMNSNIEGLQHSANGDQGEWLKEKAEMNDQLVKKDETLKKLKYNCRIEILLQIP